MLVVVVSTLMVALDRVVNRLKELDHENVICIAMVGLVVGPLKELSYTDVVIL